MQFYYFVIGIGNLYIKASRCVLILEGQLGGSQEKKANMYWTLITLQGHEESI